MAARVDSTNPALYMDTNPEGVVSAKKGAFFYRRDTEFYLNVEGNLETGNWEKLQYRTVIIPPPAASRPLVYKRPHEIWIKTTDGFYNDLNQLMPKTGWKIFSYKDAFAIQIQHTLHWIFPRPGYSLDSMGVNGDKSYDNDFLYIKFSGKWYRTPLSVYTFIGDKSPENPTLYSNPPYSDQRAGFPGANSYILACSMVGDQSYDNDFFYVRVNVKVWKRTNLNIFEIGYKMTVF